jgi:hypothetical protein
VPNNKTEENATQLQFLQEIQETSLRSSQILEASQTRNNEAFEKLEANIWRVKEIFGEGIQAIQSQR